MDRQTEKIRVQSGALREFASTLYQRVGVPMADADAVARMQVETDERGVYSHGTRALPGYVQGIRNGGINPTPNIQVLNEAPSAALLDADNSLGHVSSIRAMQIAIEKAGTTGIAAVTVRNGNHYGASACFAMMALSEGMIGFNTTKTGGASMAAYGGAEGVLGNHPLSYAIPAKDEPPIVLDMACGWAAWGHVGTYAMEGKQLPAGWVLTADGKPTQDPRQAKVMLPFGGPKGAGLALVSGLLGGGLIGGTQDPSQESTRRGHFFYAINVGTFTPLDEFTKFVDEEIRTIRNSKRAEGVDQIYMPGEIEWLHQQEAQRHGILLHRPHLDSLAALAGELGVEVFWESSGIA